ncbi:MAG: transketolase C-terminal domain-containing protein [Candidatus Peribacteraceae bacterium]|nr:transketolase C-terminal domain-containing protein [Candidatus Peribacteraceae bacterium]
MHVNRPEPKSLIGQDQSVVPLSVQRVLKSAQKISTAWIGPEESPELSPEDARAYELAHTIMKHIAIEAPRVHKSGHPGGSLSAFTFCYGLLRRRNPKEDAALRMSAGHLSLLAYGLQYLGGRGQDDPRLASPQAIIAEFRTPKGLPGHSEAGIGDIPFGFGPLGKGLSNGLGYALGKKMLKRDGVTDVMIGDGDAQEGQIIEAARLASYLALDHLIAHIDMNDIQLSSMPSHTVAADLAALFHAIGWAVIEVQNGNDPAQVEAALTAADALVGKGKPICVCYYTTMGYGVETMEAAANRGSASFHGSPMKDEDAAKELAKLTPLEEVVKEYEPFRKALASRYEGAPPASEILPAPKKLKRAVTAEKGAARRDFGTVHVAQLMAQDPRVIVLHGDLAGSGGFDAVEKEFPGRVINCGAAEANMYMMASGLRQAGMLPITYTFAAFGTNEARANARLIDINSGHVPCSVLHDCTHTGLSVGEDGETHQERNYANIPLDRTQVWCTADSNQSAAILERGMELVAQGRESAYVFMPRSGHEQLKSPSGEVIYGAGYRFDGRADLIRGNGDTSDQLTIVATGIAVHDAMAAADALREGSEQLHIRVLNIACIRPIDAAAILQAALETRHLLVVEDHHSEGGLASQVADVIADFSLPCSLRRLGVDHYFPSAPAKDLKLLAGLDTESIIDAVLDEVRAEVRGGEDAFVTAVSELAHNLQHSRFRETAQVFAKKLKEEKGYIDALRQFWASKECPKAKLPKNEDLMEQL